MTRVRYCCPKHDDVVLYEDDSRSDDSFSFKFIVPEAPRKCDRCSISYYREECSRHG